MTVDESNFERKDRLFDPGEFLEYFLDSGKKYEMLEQEHRDIITKYLGKGPRSVEVYRSERYYHKLLAWSLTRITSAPGWEIVSRHNYCFPDPSFSDVQTDYTQHESCLTDGLMLVKKDGIRLVIIISAIQAGSVQVQAAEQHHGVVKELIQEIAGFLKKNNFYRGSTIIFDGRISFINAGQREWDSVILDPVMKQEIQRQTVGFLKDCTKYEKLGISSRRGIILAGEPGTGKTIICKALVTEAEGITCITTNPYRLLSEDYITDLFAVAQDLCPSLVIIEDIDIIGQARNEFYRGTPPLIALLAEMDGIAEKKAIVTVATSNCYEVLDKALRERPSRFDRVFHVNLPNKLLRAELVKHLSETIPLSEEVRDFIVKETEGYTPAQIQEVVDSLVISNPGMEEATMQLTRDHAAAAIGSLSVKKHNPMGFNGIAAISNGSSRR